MYDKISPNETIRQIVALGGKFCLGLLWSLNLKKSWKKAANTCFFRFFMFRF